MNYENELYHFGIKGQKWGVRRYQNPDGSLTSAGKNRYNKNYTEKQRRQDRSMYGRRAEKRINRRLNEGWGLRGARHEEVRRKNTRKKALAISSTVATTLGVAFVRDQVMNDGRGTQAVLYNSKKAIKRGEQFARRFM